MDAAVALYARFAVGSAAVSLLVVGAVVLAWEARVRRGEAVASDGGLLAGVNFAGIALFAVTGFVVAVLDLGSGPVGGAPGAAVRVVGVVVLIAAGGLAIWGLRSIGRQMGSKAEVRSDHELVTRGAFGLVRHPLYLSILMLWLGGAVALLNWVLAVGFAVLVPAFYARARAEERLLVGHFGQSYRDYAARVGMFAPRLRRG